MSVRETLERIGRTCVDLVEEFGYYLTLTLESLFWIVFGSTRRQPVRLSAAIQQMVEVGIAGLPIVFVLSFSIGVMLAIQGIHTLKQFGAETQVVLGIALSVTREFGALITGILIAGRTGSALAARIGTRWEYWDILIGGFLGYGTLASEGLLDSAKENGFRAGISVVGGLILADLFTIRAGIDFHLTSPSTTEGVLGVGVRF